MPLVAQATLLTKARRNVGNKKPPRRPASSTRESEAVRPDPAGLLSWNEADAGSNHQWLEISNQNKDFRLIAIENPKSKK